MKLEVGMYCYNRINRKLGIGKVICLSSNNNVIVDYKNCRELISFGNLVASHNIIDLIEVDDVIAIKEDIDNFKEIFILGIYEQELLMKIKEKIKNNKLILVRILKKKQFESVAYKVGD